MSFWPPPVDDVVSCVDDEFACFVGSVSEPIGEHSNVLMQRFRLGFDLSQALFDLREGDALACGLALMLCGFDLGVCVLKA